MDAPGALFAEQVRAQPLNEHGRLALPGAVAVRGHVLQKLSGGGPRQTHALQKQRETPLFQSLTLPIDPGHLVEVVQGPHDAPVAQGRADVL